MRELDTLIKSISVMRNVSNRKLFIVVYSNNNFVCDLMGKTLGHFEN